MGYIWEGEGKGVDFANLIAAGGEVRIMMIDNDYPPTRLMRERET